jgi:hypothetical protein
LGIWKGKELRELNTFQEYPVEEFYDGYREGSLNRRVFVRRVAFMTDSMAATMITMSALGCPRSELPVPTVLMPSTDAMTAASSSQAKTTPSSIQTETGCAGRRVIFAEEQRTSTYISLYSMSVTCAGA